MKFFVGTSGYSYPEWKGIFYPEKLAQKKMLAYYAERFGTTEINYTFRSMPTEKLLQGWAGQVPEHFRFALKAPQSITHFKRLKGAEEPTEFLFRTAATLGEKLGPILFQLPESVKKDVSLLAGFLDSIDVSLLGNRGQIAFEFRHASWFDGEVYDVLRAHSAALCFAETEDGVENELVDSAPWGYVRLRCVNYTDAELRAWINKLKAQKWEEAYVFFKHEDTGSGPKLATRFLELAGN